MLNARLKSYLYASSVSVFGDWLLSGALAFLAYEGFGTKEQGLVQGLPHAGFLLACIGLHFITKYLPPKKTYILVNIVLAIANIAYIPLWKSGFVAILVLSIGREILRPLLDNSKRTLYPTLIEDEEKEAVASFVGTADFVGQTAGTAAGSLLGKFLGTWVFLINAATFVYAIIVVWNIPEVTTETSRTTTKVEGQPQAPMNVWRYIWSTPEYLVILTIWACVSVIYSTTSAGSLVLLDQANINTAWHGPYGMLAGVSGTLCTVTLAKWVNSKTPASSSKDSTSNRMVYTPSKILIGFGLTGVFMILSGRAAMHFFVDGIFMFKFLEGCSLAVTETMIGSRLTLTVEETLIGQLANIRQTVQFGVMFLGKSAIGLLLDNQPGQSTPLVSAAMLYVIVGFGLVALTPVFFSWLGVERRMRRQNEA